MIRVLIIDDEKLARDIIKAFLKPHQNIEIIGECSNGFEGIKAIQELRPDLLFLDIQMPKLTGFEMLELLDELPPIVFSTAFDEFAVKAFELSAADYLLKPYSQQRFDEALAKAIQKVNDQQNEESVVNEIISHSQENNSIDRIVVKLGSKIIIIPLEEVELLVAQDDYVEIHSKGKKYLKKHTMKYLENALPSERFIRVHRSYIVAIENIDRLEAYSKDSYIAILKNEQNIPVSKSGYTTLKNVLNF
ncbi:MAG: LytTR family transcriptional regulator DNA-binding domain-containing protein [Bacteroidota bacterium]